MANQDNRGLSSQPSHEESGGFTATVEQLGSSIAEKAEHAWCATRQEAQHLASNVAQSANNAREEVNNFIRRYPLLVFFGAFAVGFLVRQVMLSSEPDMTRRMSRYSA